MPPSGCLDRLGGGNHPTLYTKQKAFLLKIALCIKNKKDVIPKVKKKKNFKKRCHSKYLKKNEKMSFQIFENIKKDVIRNV